MPDSTTQQRPGPRPAQDKTGESPSPARGLASMVAGALGVVAATLPSVGIVALVLAGVAIGLGVPAMRRGPGAACFPYARLGIVLGMIAALIGVLSVAMQLFG